MSGGRRSDFVRPALSYVEVGASRAEDLLKFPPNGSEAFLREVRLGGGEDRFQAALGDLLTWQAHAKAGFEVSERQDEAGSLEHLRDGGATDTVFSASGVPFARAGERVRLRKQNGEERDFVVVRVIETEKEVGFVLGTADETGLAGEISLSVTRDAEDNVTGVARGFWHPKKRGLLGKLKTSVEVQQAIADAVAPLEAIASVISILPNAAAAAESVEDAEIVEISDDSAAALENSAELEYGEREPEPEAASDIIDAELAGETGEVLIDADFTQTAEAAEDVTEPAENAEPAKNAELADAVDGVFEPVSENVDAGETTEDAAEIDELAADAEDIEAAESAESLNPVAEKTQEPAEQAEGLASNIPTASKPVAVAKAKYVVRRRKKRR